MKYRVITAIFLTTTIALSGCTSDSHQNSKAQQLHTTTHENKVYDNLNEANVTKKGSIATTKDNKTTFVLGNHDKIIKVKIDISDMPLNLKKDEKQLNTMLHSYMEQDAKLKSVKSETKKVFYSEKINREYYTTFKLDGNGEVTDINISSYK